MTWWRRPLGPFNNYYGISSSRSGPAPRPAIPLWSTVTSRPTPSSSVSSTATTAVSGGKSIVRRCWRHRKSLPLMTSPLFYKDVLYLVRNGGIVTSLVIHPPARFSNEVGRRVP